MTNEIGDRSRDSKVNEPRALEPFVNFLRPPQIRGMKGRAPSVLLLCTVLHASCLSAMDSATDRPALLHAWGSNQYGQVSPHCDPTEVQGGVVSMLPSENGSVKMNPGAAGMMASCISSSASGLHFGAEPDAHQGGDCAEARLKLTLPHATAARAPRR